MGVWTTVLRLGPRLAGGALVASLCLGSLALVALTIIAEADGQLIPSLVGDRDRAPQPSPDLMPDSGKAPPDGAYQKLHRQTYKHLNVVAVDRYGEDGALLGGFCRAEVLLPTLKTRAHALILEKNAQGHVIPDPVDGPRLALLGITRTELDAVQRSCRFPSEVDG